MFADWLNVLPVLRLVDNNDKTKKNKGQVMKSTIVALFLSTLCLTASAYGNPKAGFMTSDVVLSVGDVPITVWYPTSNKVKGPSEYIVPAYQLEPPDDIGAPVELKIPAGATRDAPIKGGTFPLILSNPGGEAGNHMRLRNFPNNELLAAQGYIVVEAGRFAVSGTIDAELLRSLIDHMLGHHALRDSIDASKIGARGLSMGGRAVWSLAGARVDHVADERVRAIIIDESIGCKRTSPLHDCSLVKIPVMLRLGSALVPAGSYSNSFRDLENAVPRFRVILDNPAHVGFSTGTCGTVEAQRQVSVAYQAANVGVVQEPRDISYLFSGTAESIGDTAGYSASIFWNLDLLIPGLGSYGDYCGPQDGGPATPGLGTIMDNQTMIDTKHALNLAFWKTVFGNGQSNNKVENAAEKLDSVIAFDEVSE